MDADSGVGVVRRGGVSFRYVREGTGPPIVVIGSSTYYPRAFSSSLRERFELIFVDSRHFIPSYQPTDEELQNVTLETFADDVEALRDHLAIERWTVLGHSVHAQLALAYAKKYPDRTSRLILIAGVPYSFAELGQVQDRFWADHASEERKKQHEANRHAIGSALSTAPESRYFAVNYIGDAAKWWADPTYDSMPLWEGVETGPAFGRLFQLIPARTEMRGILESIQVPTLLILGKLDYGVPHATWEELIGELPSWSYVLLPADSHNPQTEAPERFDRELVRWMSDLSNGV